MFQRATNTLTMLGGHDFSGLLSRLGVSAAERARWTQLSRRLTVPFYASGMISKFDGYDTLAELDWARSRVTYGNIGRLDLISGRAWVTFRDALAANLDDTQGGTTREGIHLGGHGRFDRHRHPRLRRRLLP